MAVGVGVIFRGDKNNYFDSMDCNILYVSMFDNLIIIKKS